MYVKKAVISLLKPDFQILKFHVLYTSLQLKLAVFNFLKKSSCCIRLSHFINFLHRAVFADKGVGNYCDAQTLNG